jgi:TetR/AcrR family tetracycline transcriptional repressor
VALSKAEIIEAGAEILDEYGLSDLTMRRLAENLGVKASALYWHVPNKQSLLAELVERILDGLEVPAAVSDSTAAVAAGPDWRMALGVWSGELRERLLAHRDSADLVASMRAIGLAGTTLPQGVAELLMDAGMTSGQATVAAQTLVYFILGHVDEEQQRAQLGALATTGSSNAEKLAESDNEQGFTAGLQLLFDGMAAQLARR